MLPSLKQNFHLFFIFILIEIKLIEFYCIWCCKKIYKFMLQFTPLYLCSCLFLEKISNYLAVHYCYIIPLPSSNHVNPAMLDIKVTLKTTFNCLLQVIPIKTTFNCLLQVIPIKTTFNCLLQVIPIKTTFNCLLQVIPIKTTFNCLLLKVSLQKLQPN